MTPIALFIAPLMPLMELLFIANMRPLKSGRAFQRFWKAFAWVAVSFIFSNCTICTTLHHPLFHTLEEATCVRVCVHICVCVYSYVNY